MQNYREWISLVANERVEEPRLEWRVECHWWREKDEVHAVYNRK